MNLGREQQPKSAGIHANRPQERTVPSCSAEMFVVRGCADALL